MLFKYTVESYRVHPFSLLKGSGYLPSDYTLKIGMLNRVTIISDEEMGTGTLECLESMGLTSVRKIKILQPDEVSIT